MMKSLILAILLLFPGFALAASQTATYSVTWTDNSTSESAFNIERGPAAGGVLTKIGSVVANVTKYADVNLNDPGNVQQCYRVQAFNAVGVSAYSNIACATSPVIQLPPDGPPGVVSVTVTVTVVVTP